MVPAVEAVVVPVVPAEEAVEVPVVSVEVTGEAPWAEVPEAADPWAVTGTPHRLLWAECGIGPMADLWAAAAVCP